MNLNDQMVRSIKATSLIISSTVKAYTHLLGLTLKEENHIPVTLTIANSMALASLHGLMEIAALGFGIMERWKTGQESTFSLTVLDQNSPLSTA